MLYSIAEYDGRVNRGSLLSTSDNVPNWHQPSPTYKQLVITKTYLCSNYILIIMFIL